MEISDDDIHKLIDSLESIKSIFKEPGKLAKFKQNDLVRCVRTGTVVQVDSCAEYGCETNITPEHANTVEYIAFELRRGDWCICDNYAEEVLCLNTIGPDALCAVCDSQQFESAKYYAISTLTPMLGTIPVSIVIPE